MLQTTSEVLSLGRKLEEDSAKFYEELSRRYAKDKDVFLSFARENRKNVTHVDRTYYGVITDAIEGCFAFKMNPDDYVINTELSEKASYAEALKRAMEMEEKMIEFYSVAAQQSKSLMADVPRALAIIAKKRDSRKEALKSLLSKED
jgi:rubrerythrin